MDIASAINLCAESSCASIMLRTRNEILGESMSFDSCREEILADARVQYVLSWQKEDGYLGDVYHGGWIPKQNRKYSSAGAEAALRFLFEMGFNKNESFVKKGLEALLNNDWNRGKSSWNKYIPEIGLLGDERIRAVVFAYFGLEEIDFVQTELKATIDIMSKLTESQAISDIVEDYRGKQVFKYGRLLPEIYHIRLLAFTKSWRNEGDFSIVENAIRKLIDFSPLPETYIKYKSQLIAPARIYPRNLRLILNDASDTEWFEWFHTFELFARMGVVERIDVLSSQALDLKRMLENQSTVFAKKPNSKYFTNWGVYTGLALEKDWKNNRWINDLFFRSLLILKHSNML